MSYYWSVVSKTTIIKQKLGLLKPNKESLENNNPSKLSYDLSYVVFKDVLIDIHTLRLVIIYVKIDGQFLLIKIPTIERLKNN